MRLSKFFTLTVFLLFSSLLVGCGSATPNPKPTPLSPTTAPATAAPTDLAQPSATPTTVPSRTLVACLQEEPQTLYLYGGNSRSMWSVLEAVYDGPYDTRGFSVQPVILQKIPNLSEGEAVFKAVPVKAGDAVVDVNGNLVALKAGVSVLPSGCTQSGCAVTWDGTAELSMDQLTVDFKLIPGLKWSDGEPLSASDSVFSYEIAADPATPGSRYLTDRTFSYTALDEQTVQWVGVPGFYEQRFGSFFWLPLPKHQLGVKAAKDLLTDPQSSRSPLGWGPYIIQEWVAGDHITLSKNPNYFRASEGLPKFDTLVYRFVGNAADGNLNALLAGECDVVDQNPDFVGMFSGLQDRNGEKKLKLYTAQGPEWEHLDFGIRPASADAAASVDAGASTGATASTGAAAATGAAASASPRPDFFGDVRTRQAFAYCIDRASINATLLFGQAVVPDSFLPPDHPLYPKEVQKYPFDQQRGSQLLDEAGWKDQDGDPATPRTAFGIRDVPDGTPLALTYLTTEAPLRKQVADAVAQSLKGCGIQANVQVTNPGVLFGPGPDGLVFGRKFDLVQFSWEASSRPNCLLYASSQIPDTANRWIGANITGYSSPEYDAACADAFSARPSDPDYLQRNQKVQEIFARDLPVIPLYSSIKVAISRPDLCGMNIDVTARSIFWNLEGLDYGAGCQ